MNAKQGPLSTKPVVGRVQKFGYTTCPECGQQSVKGPRSTHPWCKEVAKLRAEVEALKQRVKQLEREQQKGLE